MADFEMRNFYHFPVERSSYDLKLELLEEMDPKEALELMKANKGFRAIYLRDPWRLIGRHVHSMKFSTFLSTFDHFDPWATETTDEYSMPKLETFEDFNRWITSMINEWREQRRERFENTVEICKLPRSAPFRCILRLQLPLLKKVKSCVKYWYTQLDMAQEGFDIASKMLSTMDSIGEWMICIHENKTFQKVVSDFKGKITDSIRINLAAFSWDENDPNLSVISKLFENQLATCKEVSVHCYVDQFSAVYKLFSKTKIQRIECLFDPGNRFSEAGFEMAMRSIVCNGIPSQNREAQISIGLDCGNQFIYDPAYDSMAIFLSAFPGIQKMPDQKFTRSYRTKIDDERDCLCELGLHDKGKPNKFSAKYVPRQTR